MKGSRRRRPLAAVLLSVAVTVATLALSPASAGATGAAHVLGFGAADELGGPGEIASSVVGLAATASGEGYWVATADGGVRPYGDARSHGHPAVDAGHPAVDVAGTPTGRGYWVATDDGRVHRFGDAGSFGSLAGTPLNRPIVGMTASPSGRGYWLVASDGGVFAFGDAGYHGSTGDIRLNSPIVGMATGPAGLGYWLVAADGGIFSFGSARFHGSLGGERLPAPAVAMASTPAGGGYWIATGAGNVRAFGSARGYGSAGDVPSPVGDFAARPRGDGYWLVTGGAPGVRAHNTSSPVMYEPARPGEPSDADFDRLAQCESGQRWNLNTGNGYYGGLQFSASTWRSLGGTGLPHEHPREWQISIGRRQWRQSGWRAWPHCSQAVGLA